MPVYTPPAEIHKLNRDPLNQEAVARLKQAKAEVDESQPHLVTLMRWGLEESDLGVTPDSLRELRSQLLPIVTGFLLNPDKVFVMSYLKEGHLSPRSLQNAQDAKDPAWRALDGLMSLVSADPQHRWLQSYVSPWRSGF